MQPDSRQDVIQDRYEPPRADPVDEIQGSARMRPGLVKLALLQEYPTTRAARDDLTARLANPRCQIEHRTAVVKCLRKPQAIHVSCGPHREVRDFDGFQPVLAA